MPVGGLQYRVLPELCAEHFLKQRDHRVEGGGQSVVTLLERNHEGMDVLDVVLQRLHQVLDRLLLLDEV